MEHLDVVFARRFGSRERNLVLELREELKRWTRGKVLFTDGADWVLESCERLVVAFSAEGRVAMVRSLWLGIVQPPVALTLPATSPPASDTGHATKPRPQPPFPAEQGPAPSDRPQPTHAAKPVLPTPTANAGGGQAPSRNRSTGSSPLPPSPSGMAAVDPASQRTPSKTWTGRGSHRVTGAAATLRNLRTKAVITDSPTRTTLVVVERCGDFVRVETPDGRSGWAELCGLSPEGDSPLPLMPQVRGLDLQEALARMRQAGVQSPWVLWSGEELTREEIAEHSWVVTGLQVEAGQLVREGDVTVLVRRSWRPVWLAASCAQHPAMWLAAGLMVVCPAVFVPLGIDWAEPSGQESASDSPATGQLAQPATTTSALVTTTSSTTTAPAECVAVAGIALEQRSRAVGLRARAEQASSNWEKRLVSYTETRAAFTEAATEGEALHAEALTFDPPAALLSVYARSLNALASLAESAGALVSGLEAPDDGSARRTAIESVTVADEEHRLAVEALLALAGLEDMAPPATEYAAPWSAAPLTEDAVPALVGDAWGLAANRNECAVLFSIDLGSLADDALLRDIQYGGGWGLAWDLPSGPGRWEASGYCPNCGQQASGLAGTGMPVSGLEDTVWPNHLAWTNGSYGSYGYEGHSAAEAGQPLLSHLTIEGQNCLYKVWIYLGEEHLLPLIEQLRFVEGMGAP